MPYTEKQREAGYAEIARRKRGDPPQNFKGMTLAELEKWVELPLEKPKGVK